MKASTAAAGRTAAFANSSSSTNRRQSTRAVRANAVRPPNYYARSFSYRSGDQASVAGPDGTHNEAPGFFPAITFFTDGVAALPKEVMRHFTLLKETEGKAHQFGEVIDEIFDTIQGLPEPVKRTPPMQSQSFVGMSLNNSINGSATASIIDGATPAVRPANFADAPSIASPDRQFVEEQGGARRELFSQLQGKMLEILPVLDEKNMMLSATNDTLARQLSRLETTLPFVEQEVSEEARLGSNVHWALAHMKDMRKGNNIATTERSRREVQAANSLAAAAAVVHEGDIAATRSEARREALLAKRKNQNVDSDFDERPGNKRTNQASKGRKVRDPSSTVDGKASANGTQAHKRRKVEKTASAAPGQFETSMSAALNGRLGVTGPGAGTREVVGETGRKKAKASAAPAARKRNAPNSPSAASSPTRAAFAPTNSSSSKEPGSSNRGGGAAAAAPRGRQNSSQSGKAQNTTEAARGRPSTVANGGKGGHGVTTSSSGTGSTNDGRTGVRDTTYSSSGGNMRMMDNLDGTAASASMIKAAESAAASALKREDTEPVESTNDGPEAPASSIAMATTRSRQGSRPTNKPDAPGSADMANPMSPSAAAATTASGAGAAPAMSRSRSTRGANNATNATNNNNTSSGVGAQSPSMGVLDSPRHRAGHKSRASVGNNNITSPPATTSTSANAATNTAIAGIIASASSASATGATRGYSSSPPSHADAARSPTHPSHPNSTKHASSGMPNIASTTNGPAPMLSNSGKDAASLSSRTNSNGTATANVTAAAASAKAAAKAAKEDQHLHDGRSLQDADAALLDAEAEADADVDPDADEDDEPPSSPASDEPRYCVCGQVSYGDMIACDNDNCPREWFHLACVGLTKPPGSKTKWYCDECKELMRGRHHGGRSSGR